MRPFKLGKEFLPKHLHLQKSPLFTWRSSIVALSKVSCSSRSITPAEGALVAIEKRVRMV
jgi:hypothetical protein